MRAVLDFVGEAHDSQALDEFRAMLLPGFRRLVQTDYASYNEVRADGRALATMSDPELPSSAHEAWARHATSNPLLNHFMHSHDGRPRRMSDVVSRAEFRRSAIYRELYLALGIEHQVAFILPSAPELTVGIALSRGGSDFTDRDCRVLDLTRPHLIQAYRNAELRQRLTSLLAGLRDGIETERTSLILLEEDGSVGFASESARNLIESVTGESVREGRPLPGAIGAWAAGSESTASLPVPDRDDTLLARSVSTRGGGRVVLLERAGRVLSPDMLENLGLTPREAAVLHAHARGLEGSAVATNLNISPRTVAKHMQRIHAKLGVRNRAQAVAIAWAAVGSSTDTRFRVSAWVPVVAMLFVLD